MKKIDKQRFEFVLLINGHIICQRYFDIRNYNEDSTNSFEMKELVDRIAGVNIGPIGSMGIIPNHLKIKSREYLWGYFDPHGDPQTPEDIDRRDIYKKIDTFGFQIKIDGDVVGETQFSGNVFPPKVRYQVNIKDVIPEIMLDIRQTLSKKTYSDSYAGGNLKYDYVPYTFGS